MHHISEHNLQLSSPEMSAGFSGSCSKITIPSISSCSTTRNPTFAVIQVFVGISSMDVKECDTPVGKYQLNENKKLQQHVTHKMPLYLPLSRQRPSGKENFKQREVLDDAGPLS